MPGTGCSPATVRSRGWRLARPSPGTMSVTIPPATPPGNYFLLACADDTLQVMESDETNNCRASGTKLKVNP